MPQLNDAKFAALRAQLFTGAMPDMTLQWLQANGATSPATTDAWEEMLAATLVGTPTGQRNDDWFALLGELSYTGSLNDRELQFWAGGGLLVDAELVVNGTFDADTNWTKATSWTIAGGIATCDGTQPATPANLSAIAPIAEIAVGLTFRASIDVLRVDAGGVRLNVGGSGVQDGSPFYTTVGTHVFLHTILVNPNNSFHVQGDLNFDGDIDNVTLVQVF